MVTDVTVSSQRCENPHEFPRYPSIQKNPATLGRAGLAEAAAELSCRHLDHHCAGYVRPACRDTSGAGSTHTWRATERPLHFDSPTRIRVSMMV